MRKNLYDNNIRMINNGDIFSIFDSLVIASNEQAADRLRNYSRLIGEYLMKESGSCIVDGSKEFGITVKDDIDKQLIDIFDKVYLTQEDIDLESIKNAYLFAVINKSEIRDFLENALVGMRETPNLCRGEFIEKYGEDTLNYILAHAMYEYKSDHDPIIESDKKVLLCNNDSIEEMELTIESDYSRNNKKVPLHL